MFIGITKHYIYGVSGNELPPPVKKCIKYAEVIDVETYQEAYDVMAKNVLPLRREAERNNRPYSSPDGWDWEVVSLRNRPKANELEEF